MIIHPKFRGIGLGAFLVRETMPKVDAKVVEVLAVMAKYNPFFEKAGMLRVDYRRDEISEEKKIRRFLEACMPQKWRQNVRSVSDWKVNLLLNTHTLASALVRILFHTSSIFLLHACAHIVRA